MYASADQWEWQHREAECSLCSMWCHSVTQHRFHECVFTKVRVLAWSGHACDILCAAGIPRDRIALRWGGVEVLGHPGLFIVWCHPAKGAAIYDSSKSVKPVWPIWLGLGPIRGISLVLSKLGVSQPHILIYQVLECAYAMVHGGYDTDNVRLPCPLFHSQWSAGMNSGVLLGFQTPTAHLDSHTPSNLLWVLFSSVRGKGYVGHVLVSCKGTVKMTVWHSKVPSVWICECQGNLHSVVREAMRRRLGGEGVYWCLLGVQWPWEGLRQDSGLQLWRFMVRTKQSCLSLGWVISDASHSRGVPPHVLKPVLDMQIW